MRVLVACEFSGTVRDEFAKRGHEAWSCDILPTEKPGPHFEGDVFKLLEVQPDWDLMIAHPPCTYLANSGVQHLHKKEGRWKQMREAKEFFMKLLNSNIPRICVENPIPHGYAELPKYTQIVQPFMFGHEVMKKTCLWLKNLPPLVPTNVVGHGEKYIGKDGKSNGSMWYQRLTFNKDRWKIRSTTFQGIAEAMAEQWSNYDSGSE